jgi:hypothetical protein
VSGDGGVHPPRQIQLARSGVLRLRFEERVPVPRQEGLAGIQWKFNKRSPASCSEEESSLDPAERSNFDAARDEWHPRAATAIASVRSLSCWPCAPGTGQNLAQNSLHLQRGKRQRLLALRCLAPGRTWRKIRCTCNAESANRSWPCAPGAGQKLAQNSLHLQRGKRQLPLSLRAASSLWQGRTTRRCFGP